MTGRPHSSITESVNDRRLATSCAGVNHRLPFCCLSRHCAWAWLTSTFSRTIQHDDEQPHQVRTGGDPCSLPQVMALRDEMSKLTHQACPEVDWVQAEILLISLFEINGVELQVAV